ncbi:MerR family transcriptional regulator [Agromyces soli]|uniref:MerR family transcriptional regulator n=1 Tax=Agromyces soli TaxID=659012 RepID=A0ABY4AS95_9MICO|nr:MerR family transcriptional regulator [Agromyces soli]UOE26067.1 MerR family transcriptional regulator [Agromyces soli]
MHTTGQIAQLTALSEKAIRLYADRGLLVAERNAAHHRVFDDDQVDRARRIVLLRALDLSLSEVRAVLDADDPTRAFDAHWEGRRRTLQHSSDVAEYVRRSLSGPPELPDGLDVQRRSVPDRVVLAKRGTATLPAVPAVLPQLTGELFTALLDAEAPLTGPPFVEYLTRATESSPAQLRGCVPFDGSLTPAAGLEITLDPAHDELFVPLAQQHADDQALLVAVHDYLTATHGRQRTGANRESYFRSFGTGADGEVMEVGIPVTSARLDDAIDDEAAAGLTARS